MRYIQVPVRSGEVYPGPVRYIQVPVRSGEVYLGPVRYFDGPFPETETYPLWCITRQFDRLTLASSFWKA